MEPNDQDRARANVVRLRDATSPEETILPLTEMSEYAREEPCFVHQKALIDAGGITSILEVMEIQLNAGVQAKCCSTLQRLAFDDIDLKVILVEADGIPAIIRAMNRYPNDAEVQLAACSLLEDLSWDAKITRKIVHAAGMLALDQAIENFPNDKGITRLARRAKQNLIRVEEHMEAWRDGDLAHWTEYGTGFLDPDP